MSFLPLKVYVPYLTLLGRVSKTPQNTPQTGIGGIKRKTGKPEFLCVRISKNCTLFGVQSGCTFSIQIVIFGVFGVLGSRFGGFEGFDDFWVTFGGFGDITLKIVEFR